MIETMIVCLYVPDWHLLGKTISLKGYSSGQSHFWEINTK